MGIIVPVLKAIERLLLLLLFFEATFRSNRLVCYVTLSYCTRLMWPRRRISYLCQEYVSSKIAESIRALMLVSIKV